LAGSKDEIKLTGDTIGVETGITTG
jgi:hypothetical protein